MLIHLEIYLHMAFFWIKKYLNSQNFRENKVLYVAFFCFFYLKICTVTLKKIYLDYSVIRFTRNITLSTVKIRLWLYDTIISHEKAVLIQLLVKLSYF